MTATIEIRSVYGNEAIYPVCDRAKLFADIAGTKTLTRRTICQMEALGFEIICKQPVFSH